MIFPVATGGSGGSYSSVNPLYVSTCTSLSAVAGVSTCTATEEGLPSVSGTRYFLVTGLVVNSLALTISLFAHILFEDGPLGHGLVLRRMVPGLAEGTSFLETVSMGL